MNRTINGININYEEKGEGELIVLLHGWGSNIKLFANLIDLLSKKYKVVAMDMPGFGESQEPPSAWCVDDYADFVIEFLKAYNTDKVMLYFKLPAGNDFTINPVSFCDKLLEMIGEKNHLHRITRHRLLVKDGTEFR